MPAIDEIVRFLEERGGLALGESPWEKGDLSEQYDVMQVDWRRLFPTGRPIPDGEAPWELSGDEWSPDADPQLMHRILTPIDDWDWRAAGKSRDDWDACAWYQPIHFHGFDWGIYIREECLYDLAQRLGTVLALSAGPLSYPHHGPPLFKALIRTAFLLYFRHEFYHHKTECLGLRLHAIENRSSYLPYFDLVYRASVGTEDQLEEALANAHMYREMRASPYNGWIPGIVAKAARTYLENTFPRNPPGYSEARHYLGDFDFSAGQNLLQGRVHEANLHPRRVAEWRLAPRLNQSFFDVTDDIWTVVPKGAPAALPVTALPVKTCSSREMVRLHERNEYEVVKGGKGSHIKMKDRAGSIAIIPGNRKNLSPGVTNKLLKGLGNYKIDDLPGLLERRR